ncbi:MAG: hypothetical protein ACT4P3_00080 [Betaproteobacteria bacterium]
MAYADLEEARRHHAALKRLIERHAGEAADLRALRRAVDLCRGAAEAVNDAYCREKIRVAAEFAAELLSQGEHAKWRREPLSGVDFLKQQALNALELFQSRLYSLEWARRAAARGFVLNPRGA